MKVRCAYAGITGVHIKCLLDRGISCFLHINCVILVYRRDCQYTMYLGSFTLPIDMEDDLLADRAAENGGAYGYVDNPYPCGLFAEKDLFKIEFKKITIFYGGNGSGKSTLLNLIAEKLKLNRIAPYNSSEMFASYVGNCELELVMMLEEMARYCGCQFVIATHSPFLLALDGARIYDLDSKPIKIREWWELENTRLYFEFFEKNRHLFQK